jgi:signal transduction histidine kinase
MLTGLDLQLAALGHVDPDKLGEMRTMIQTMTDQVRQLSMDLRPATLDRYGLLTALTRHIERFQTQAGIQIDLRHQGLDGRFAPEIEIAAFRIVQEALTNIARHAQVEHAAIQLLAEGDTLLIVIRDHGVGFDPTVRSNNGGLSGMRERAELVGGTLTIDTSEGGGVVITAELPLRDSGPSIEASE